MVANREVLLDDIARYAETDLLCYRVPISKDNPLAADNTMLRKKQDTMFDPILGWVAKEFGAAFNVTEGITPVEQSEEARAIIGSAFEAADEGELAALSVLVPLLGSALLSLALWKGRITVEEALVAARLDEEAQAERWGEDTHAAAAWAVKVKDIKTAALSLTSK